jgi:alpha-glucosidase
MKKLLILVLFAAATPLPAIEQVNSPDRSVVVEFVLDDQGHAGYRINHRGRPIVLLSRLGFPGLEHGFSQLQATRREHRGEWTQEFGERRLVPDNYHELSVGLRHASGRLLTVIFRAYDEGAALRYVFPEQATTEFHFPEGERTEFRLPTETFGWEAHGTEGEYRRVPVGNIQPYCERPLTLEFSHGAFASLAEAANFNYPRMLLSPLPGVPGGLMTALRGSSSNLARDARFDQRHDPSVRIRAGESTPWRMLVLGDKPGDLLERNHLMLNLNPPSAIADTSWIKPGKVIRETTLSTAGGLACVDFAAQHGLHYVHLDAGWYGPERSAPQATGADPSRNLDLPQVIRYGAAKGIGVLLYVNKLALGNGIDALPALYRSWGVKGMKFGFVNVGAQTETAWLLDAIRKCAAEQIMVNVHDGFRSSGLSRTWPNLMTVEGIRGNEHFPTAEHNCTLPFTRYVAGAGDYTICYYSKKLIHTTHAHQLAMAVVSFSPLQWLFWYDRPSSYQGEPEIEFFRQVPTVWDETRVLHGRIGEYATIARRKGEAWFVGTINAKAARTLKVPLAFLPAGRRFTAHLYADDDTVATATKVGVTTRTVDSTTALDIPLLVNGGQAIWIEPMTESGKHTP